MNCDRLALIGISDRDHAIDHQIRDDEKGRDREPELELSHPPQHTSDDAEGDCPKRGEDEVRNEPAESGAGRICCEHLEDEQHHADTTQDQDVAPGVERNVEARRRPKVDHEIADHEHDDRIRPELDVPEELDDPHDLVNDPEDRIPQDVDRPGKDDDGDADDDKRGERAELVQPRLELLHLCLHSFMRWLIPYACR